MITTAHCSTIATLLWTTAVTAEWTEVRVLLYTLVVLVVLDGVWVATSEWWAISEGWGQQSRRRHPRSLECSQTLAAFERETYISYSFVKLVSISRLERTVRTLLRPCGNSKTMGAILRLLSKVCFVWPCVVLSVLPGWLTGGWSDRIDETDRHGRYGTMKA